ncbi:hypothetical protein [Paracoccus benzoatiresistens]|uniref:Uncharacterized protein n=1 Tax=Paracoccus benzoatiresistens TaxID=2997341 RepID=A0ABT4JBC1_9RHOB|nr:hypothetical protein [Paracoccus sp. EF6]MCZ0964378.1 hypothetical protein [Paracoccus sp. EF6]
MSIKDPFEILADEITLIRRQIDQLQRTSLDRKDAEKLNAVVVQGLDRMAKVGPAVQQRIEQSLATAALDLRQHTVYAASEGAKEAIREAHLESIKAAGDLRKAAGEARREAWRWFGGFWVWLTSGVLTGVLLGVLGMFLLQGYGNAHKFGEHPGVFCRSAGGETMFHNSGDKACVFWLERSAGE